MGKKRVFTRSADERLDLDVIGVKVELDEPLETTIINARVDVEILTS